MPQAAIVCRPCAIPVEKGQHKVSCCFSTDVFHKGLMLSLVSLLFTLVLGGWGLKMSE
jgi:hypothetical protein